MMSMSRYGDILFLSYFVASDVLICANHAMLQFLLGTIAKTPDLYLDELQEMLAASCGRTVSRATIWRTLRRAGFTMKKVILPLLSCFGFLICSRSHVLLQNDRLRNV